MPNPKSLRDIIGSTHVAGKYNFTDADYLNEGADKLLELGTRVGKFWFPPDPGHYYRFNSQWPKFSSLVGLAETDYFASLFAKPFTTFILEAYAAGASEQYYQDGVSPEAAAREREQFYELTKHLLTRYKGSGKTFILQNWEGDWILTDPKFTKEPREETIQGMIDWLNARQDGVDRARQEVGMDGVTVAHAAEVNLIVRAMEGKVTVTNNVVPHTHCDLYSYSAYDTMINAPDRFRDALDYLADKAPDSELFGAKNVFVGEYGAPENEFDQLEYVKRTVETALDWGAPYIVYWELYCNEPVKDSKYEGRPTNSDCRGFWLIRADGSKSPACHYFAELFDSESA